MRSGAARRLSALALAALTTGLVAACSGTEQTAPDPDDDATTVEEDQDDGGDAAPTDDASVGSPGQEPSSPAKCAAFPLEPGVEVSGQVLGDCVVAAMVAAGSGTHLVDSGDGVSVVDFAWVPEFSMSADAAGTQVVVRGDTGWIRGADGWVQGDSGSADPEQARAGSIVDIVRAAGDPRTMSALLATSSSWTVEDEVPVPDDAAFVGTAWRVVADEPLEALGVAVTDVEIYLGPGHLTAYYTGTGTFQSISVTTRDTYTQWGGEVDIPDPS